MATKRMNYADAMLDTFRICFKEDPHFTIIGNEVLGIGPTRLQFEPLQEEYADRIYFPPTSEAAFTALAAGAAMCGHRTFAHLGVASFTYPAVSSIANEVATICLSSGGRIRAPFIMHLNHGVVMGTSSQHSESPQCMYWNLPGIEIALPSSGSEFKGLMRTAMKSNNPVMIFTHGLLYAAEDDVPEGDHAIPFGQAAIKRKGKDATVVATSLTVGVALKAAEQLARENIDIEVIDPRTLVPFDKKTLLASVAKTGRLVTADETRLNCGVGSEICRDRRRGRLPLPQGTDHPRRPRPGAGLGCADARGLRDPDSGEDRRGGEGNAQSVARMRFLPALCEDERNPGSVSQRRGGRLSCWRPPQ